MKTNTSHLRSADWKGFVSWSAKFSRCNEGRAGSILGKSDAEARGESPGRQPVPGNMAIRKSKPTALPDKRSERANAASIHPMFSCSKDCQLTCQRIVWRKEACFKRKSIHPQKAQDLLQFHSRVPKKAIVKAGGFSYLPGKCTVLSAGKLDLPVKNARKHKQTTSQEIGRA